MSRWKEWAKKYIALAKDRLTIARAGYERVELEEFIHAAEHIKKTGCEPYFPLQAAAYALEDDEEHAKDDV